MLGYYKPIHCPRCNHNMTTDINSVNFTDYGILEFMQIPATSFKCTKCNYGYDFDLGKVIADELIKQ